MTNAQMLLPRLSPLIFGQLVSQLCATMWYMRQQEHSFSAERPGGPGRREPALAGQKSAVLSVLCLLEEQWHENQ